MFEKLPQDILGLIHELIPNADSYRLYNSYVHRLEDAILIGDVYDWDVFTIRFSKKFRKLVEENPDLSLEIFDGLERYLRKPIENFVKDVPEHAEEFCKEDDLT